MNPSHTRIKGILIDFYGTIVYEGPEEEMKRIQHKAFEKIAEYLSLYGRRVSAKELMNVFDEEFDKYLKKANALNTELDYWLVFWSLLKRLGIKPSIKLALKCMDIIFTINTSAVNVFPDVHEVLPKLRNMGLKLAVVSNATIRLEYIVRRLKLAKYFDAIIASYKVLTPKPNPMIFKKALNVLNLQPYEAVMIGDSFKNDVIGAKNVGIKGVLLVRNSNRLGEIERIVNESKIKPDFIVSNFYEFYDYICNLL